MALSYRQNKAYRNSYTYQGMNVIFTKQTPAAGGFVKQTPAAGGFTKQTPAAGGFVKTN